MAQHVNKLEDGDLYNQYVNITEYPNTFKRQGAFPLEQYSVFSSLDAAKDYAKNNSIAYVGQEIAVVNSLSNSVTMYVIENESGTLKEIGYVLIGDNLSVEIVDEKIKLKDFGNKYYRYDTSSESNYILTEGFKNGLEPKVKMIEDGLYELVWYEPYPVSIKELHEAVEDLQEKSTNIYSKEETNNLIKSEIANSSHLKKTIVDNLPNPETDSIDENTIYMVKDETITSGDVYKEYMLINGVLVQTGDTSTDLTNFYIKSEIDSKISNLEEADLDTKQELASLITSMYNGSYVVGNEVITSNIIESDRDSSRLISPNEIAKLAALVLDDNGSVGVSGTISADNVTGLENKIVSVVTGNISEGTNALGIEKGAEVNIIEAIKINNIALEISKDRSVNITPSILNVYTKSEIGEISEGTTLVQLINDNSNNIDKLQKIVVGIGGLEEPKTIIDYVNQQISNIPLATVLQNNDTLNPVSGLISPEINKFELVDGKVKKISTDLLEQGENYIIFDAGTAVS